MDNPLAAYPDRGWEKVYRDQYRYDSSFTFVCSPNDTHHCRLRAFVRNGVIMRIEQNYAKIQGGYSSAETWWRPGMPPPPVDMGNPGEDGWRDNHSRKAGHPGNPDRRQVMLRAHERIAWQGREEG